MPNANSGWEKADIKGFITPGTVGTIQQDKVEGTIAENGLVKTDSVDDRIILANKDAIPIGSPVRVRIKNGYVYVKPTEQIEADEKRAKEALEQRRKERKRRLKKERREFWNSYDIPITFSTAQNSRLGELRRGSTGTGATPSTVQHLCVLEDFKDGRIERESGEFLCRNEGKFSDNTFHTDKIKPAEQGEETEKITCKTCLKRMERWKKDTSPEGENS